ncbi:GntR family transcriptional regulator [Sporosarcina sp. P26b]|uniref:GntR family transcriptional regulator n=1 Tax=Sporosarcina sp. P26b TaxID=2048253 RepID=UPI001E5CDA55|nr:GntR family transcriptional regulator [Sporosarcina sp. P26b]
MKKIRINPIEKVKTTKEIVYEQIKNAVFNGDISRDEMITETMLAESLNTSRTPVREAVSDLLNEGLLISVPRKGLRVRDVTQSEKEQILYLRLSIEREGLKKLLPQVTPSQVSYLREIIDMQKETLLDNNRIKFIEMDQEFHRKIVNYSEQYLLEDILLNIYNLSRLVGHKALAKDGRMEEVIEEHLQIIDALENKDMILVQKCMEDHLLRTSDSIVIVERK